MFSKTRIRQLGFTLIEIVTTIIVVGIAAAALLGVFGNLVSTSADPAIQQQAVTIAEAYMEEIRSKSFADPQGGEVGLGSAEEGNGNRDLFDDVQDYNNLNTIEVRNQSNAAITELENYEVTVSIDRIELVTNSATPVSNIPLADSLQITVTVDNPGITPVSLVSYRANF